MDKKRRRKKKMQRQERKQKGITLVALVITIIVLLILAGTTTTMLVGKNGILNQANKAKIETQKANEDELRKLAMLEATMNLENKLYTDKKGDTVTIPAGFAVSHVEGENIIDEGLVIIDKEGNEFVYVPVSNIIAVDMNKDQSIDLVDIDLMIDNNQFPMAIQTEINGTKHYRGILYDWSNFSYTSGINSIEDFTDLTSGIREPAYLTASETADSSKYNNIGITQELLQEEFDKMIEKVLETKGFFVSRYEMSGSETAESKANSISITAGTLMENNEYYRWYGLYTFAKTYNVSVYSNMIWGCQYDQMMLWMIQNGIDITTAGHYYNDDSSKTGMSDDKDIILNVFDLYGGREEWTLAGNNFSTRVLRGGNYEENRAPSTLNWHYPSKNHSGWSTRFVIYL